LKANDALPDEVPSKTPKLQQTLATALCGGVAAPGNSVPENLCINLGRK